MNKKVEEYAWKKKRAVIYRRLKNIHTDDKKVRVLDIGCNNGGQFSDYSKIIESGEFIGLDIKKFKEWGSLSYDFVVGDARMLPFKNETFDIIIATEVLEHFVEGEAFLKEAHRILKNNGLLIITTPNRSRFYMIPKNTIAFFKRKRIVAGFTVEHPREYTLKELEKLLETTGFGVEFHDFIAFSPYLKTPFTLYIFLDNLSDKIFKKFLKWDMLVIAKKF